MASANTARAAFPITTFPCSTPYDRRPRSGRRDYLRKLAPEPRHAIRTAIKALVDDLEGFHRLRIGPHRVIFEYEIIEGRRTITCVFTGQRKWIYEVFQSRILE